MIIIGYPGIGKSTLARKDPRYIDLCPEDFIYNGSRPEHWYVYYCNIAERLSKQGYIVFVASHETVRRHLSAYSREKLLAVYPSITLKNEWIAMLKKRYEVSRSNKDERAYQRAKKEYLNDISALSLSGIRHVEIWKMDYNLAELIKDFISQVWI